nr:MFS transporter [Candidatus Sigynarchaeota archaeon]
MNTLEPIGILKKLKQIYRVLQACCFVSWGANVIFMIFGVVFMNERGVSLSGIFLLNLLVIVVSFFTSTFLNKKSDKLKKRKQFMVLAYVLRTVGILFLVFGDDIIAFVIHNVITNLLNPLSIDVAIIYELGEDIAFLDNKVHGTPVNPNVATRYYLRYRMLGSLGWALMAPFAGFFIMYLNNTVMPVGFLLVNLPGYRIFLLASCLIYAAVSILFWLVYDEDMLTRLKSQKGEPPHATIDVLPTERSIANNALKLSPAFALLLIAIFTFQIGASLFQTPYAIFMKTFSKGNLFYVGISYFLSAILEAPLFTVAYWIIKRKGYSATLSLAFLLEIVRVLATVVVIPLNQPELVLPLQMMNSFCFRWPSITHGISVVSSKQKATGVNSSLIAEKAGGFCGSVVGSLLAGTSSDLGTYNYIFTFSLMFLSITEGIFSLGSFIQANQRASKKILEN